VRAGTPITDNLSSEIRYSILRQSLSLSPALMICSPPNCLSASAAVKQAALNGPVFTSAVGSTVAYSTLDNPRNPHDGLRAELRQDIAGLGGGADFLRSTGDVRYYKTFGDEVVGMARAQGGTIAPYGGQTLPLTSSFFGGPQLVRGFAPNGFGPRDVTSGTTMDNIGGSSYWATTAQLTAPIPGMPPEVPLKGGFFADAGSLWGYRGQTTFPALSQSLTVADSRKVRSSVGATLIWDSPFGALHVDYAMPLSKAPYDVTQRLGFGAGPF
jgi:outer membrane protein insertion porin family